MGTSYMSQAYDLHGQFSPLAFIVTAAGEKSGFCDAVITVSYMVLIFELAQFVFEPSPLCSLVCRLTLQDKKKEPHVDYIGLGIRLEFAFGFQN